MTKQQLDSTGLGLAISKQLVELMGELMDGELQVESKYGEGSRFWFDIDYLPKSNE